MDKKAQGLSLNTIIIAIIVLIVLVVIIMVFTGYFGTRFTPGVTSCENSGGTCQFAGDDETAPCGFDSFGSSLAKLSGTCPGEQICCSKGLGKSDTGVKTDTADCGNEGKDPCSSGAQCKTGLEIIGGKCKTPVPCTASDWTCTTWSACTSNSQTRTCTLKNNDCTNPEAVKPSTSQTC